MFLDDKEKYLNAASEKAIVHDFIKCNNSTLALDRKLNRCSGYPDPKQDPKLLNHFVEPLIGPRANNFKICCPIHPSKTVENMGFLQQFRDISSPSNAIACFIVFNVGRRFVLFVVHTD
uniref:Uncharacterized protein n=1 Tax=Romanomermis culicivorax TaxID=13658 RepID=A0A915KR83_ROMCU